MITYLYTLDYDDSGGHAESVMCNDNSQGTGEPRSANKHNTQRLKTGAQHKFSKYLKGTHIEKDLLGVIGVVNSSTAER